MVRMVVSFNHDTTIAARNQNFFEFRYMVTVWLQIYKGQRLVKGPGESYCCPVALKSAKNCLPSQTGSASEQVICHTSATGDPGNTMQMSDNRKSRASSAFTITGEGQPLQKNPGPLVWGLGMEPITSTRKK